MTPDEKRWLNVRMTPFVQDTLGWTNPATGERWPPTWAWTAQLLATRSDGENFYAAVTVPDADWGSLETMAPYIEKALLSLEDYRLCDCTAQATCGRHLKRSALCTG